ncbi:MAG TPA: hypothetical protein VGI14_21320 [Casimicrobiaceae bacterium]|jgi:hypothetical protein
MQRLLRRPARAALLLLGAFALALIAQAASAARIGVLSNKNFAETANDFQAKIPGHTFTGIDVGAGPPPLSTLTTQYDALLLFEDGTFAQAPAVGTVVAQFAKTGRPVVLGTFYDQDRSDAPPGNGPHGWGDLETIDPNTTDGVGTAYAPRSLGSVVPHVLTAGVTTLTSAKFAGGNQAKPGTVVVATWAQNNVKGNPDPVVAYRVTGLACVIHVAIAPDYPEVGVQGVDFGGDFYQLWSNAFDFAAERCATGAPPVSGAVPIPALSAPVLALMAGLLLGFALLDLSRRPRRAR